METSLRTDSQPQSERISRDLPNSGQGEDPTVEGTVCAEAARAGSALGGSEFRVLECGGQGGEGRRRGC